MTEFESLRFVEDRYYLWGTIYSWKTLLHQKQCWSKHNSWWSIYLHWVRVRPVSRRQLKREKEKRLPNLQITNSKRCQRSWIKFKTCAKRCEETFHKLLQKAVKISLETRFRRLYWRSVFESEYINYDID